MQAGNIDRWGQPPRLRTILLDYCEGAKSGGQIVDGASGRGTRCDLLDVDDFGREREVLRIA